jgi:cell division protein FtsL
MPRSTKQQRGASRNGQEASSSKGGRSGGPSARARTTSGRSTSSSPRKPRTSSARSRGAKAPGRRVGKNAPLRSRWVLAAVLGAAAMLVWAVYPALLVQRETSHRVAGLQAQYDTLRKRNAVLRAKVADLKTPEGVERAAREDLGLAMPGENVYVVVPSAPSSAAAGATQEAAAPDPLTALLDALFGER